MLSIFSKFPFYFSSFLSQISSKIDRLGSSILNFQIVHNKSDLVKADRKSTLLCYDSPGDVFDEVAWPIRTITYSFLAFFLVTGLWSTLAPLSSYVTASGTVSFLNEKFLVQTASGGIIEKVFVKNGDHVSKGQKIASFNSSKASAELSFVQHSLFSLRLTEARVLSEINNSHDLILSDSLINESKNNPELLKIVEAQKSVFLLRKQAHESKLALYNGAIKEIGLEIESAAQQRDESLKRRLYIEESLKNVEELVKSGAVAKSSLRDMLYKFSEVLSSFNRIESHLLSLKEKLSSSKMNMEHYKSTFAQSLEDEFLNVRKERLIFEERERHAKFELDNANVYSPRSGIITNMLPVGVGSMINMGSLITEIVSDSNELVINAKILSDNMAPLIESCSGNVADYGKDANKLIEAQVKITTYRGRRYRNLKGYVTYISADSNVDRASGMSFYNLRIVIPDGELGKHSGISLYPGLKAAVFIKAKSRTMASYLLDPVLSLLSSSIRE